MAYRLSSVLLCRQNVNIIWMCGFGGGYLAFRLSHCLFSGCSGWKVDRNLLRTGQFPGEVLDLLGGYMFSWLR